MERNAKTKCKQRLRCLFTQEEEEEDDIGINWDNFYIRDSIFLKKSSIQNAGLGVFVAIDFQENDIITEYLGKKINNEQVEQLTSQNKFHYIAQLSKDISIDGYRFEKIKNSFGFGSMINDIQNKKKTNCALFATTKNRRLSLFIVAIKPIYQNEELFLNYGLKYWNQFTKQV